VSAIAARIPSKEEVGSYLTWRRLPVLLAFGVVAFAVAYVLFIATIPGTSGAGSWRTTTFGSAVHDPSSFLKILLDSITFAAALFIVASGFALIFGLMRIVNMAHGAFYLLGGYIAYEVQQGMTGQGFSIASSDVNTWEWLVPLAVAAPSIAIVGLITQQAFLRWNQGQELRQALITIAVSVIIADQIIAHFPRNTSQGQRFGGNAVDLTWPG
jgi:branched-chain amino acid transport system permease protein